MHFSEAPSGVLTGQNTRFISIFEAVEIQR